MTVPSARAPRPGRRYPLLRRLAQAVHEQNWFAVGLELVIVVLGVVIGFQVTAWGQERSEQAQEEAYYRDLIRDVEADTTEYAIAIAMTTRSLETARHVHSVIVGEPIASDRPLSKALYYASWVNYPDWSSGTIEELYGAGTIRLIRDEAVKDALHAYRSLVAEWRPRLQGPEYSAYQAYRRSTAGLIPVEAAIAYEYSGWDERVEGVRVDEQALAERLRGDPRLLRETARMMIEWASLLNFYDEQVREAVELLDVLKRRVESGPKTTDQDDR